MKVNCGEVLGKVGKNVVEGCKVAFCVGLLALPYLSTSKPKYTVRYGEAEYNDAVKAVVSSDMYSHDMSTVIEALKKDADTTYYGAIISIVNSNMYSHEKVKTIIDISK